MALKWVESGTAASRDLSFFVSSTGTAASDGTITKYGGRSLKFTNNGSARFSDGSVGSSGRLTAWVYIDASNGVVDFTLSPCLQFRVSATLGKIQVNDAAGGTFKSGTFAVSPSTWYRVCFSWNIVGTSSWSMNGYITAADDTSPAVDLSASNSDFSLVSASPTQLGVSASFTGTNFYVNGIVVDDVSDLSDMGDVRVTAKLPSATGNANNFSTVIGASASRWTAISERALSLTNGWKEIGTTAVEESYGIEAAAGGDIDISAKTIVGRMAWVYGKRDVYAVSASASVNSTTKATTTALPSISVTSGNYIVVALADQIAGTAPTCAKTAGTATIGAVTALTGPSTSTVRLSKWYIQVTGTGTLTLTFTHDNSAGSRAGVVAEFPSISASPLDINATNTTDGTSQYDGPASGTLAQANELVVSLFAFAGPSTDTFAIVGSSDTAIVNNGTTGGGASSNSTLRMIARAVESTATVTPSMTDTTANRAGVQGLVSLKMSAGGGAGSPKLINNGSDVAIVLTSSNQLFTDITTSASYPSASGKVGMKSTGNLNDTYLYECGVLIVYRTPVANTYTQTPDGGASAIGGTTATLHSKTWAPNSGIQCGGSDAILKSKSFAASGGIQTAGSGVHLVNIVHRPDGGATAIGGGFIFLKQKTWAPSSGVSVSSQTGLVKEKTFVPTGLLIQTGGTGVHSVEILHLASGGATIAGGAAFLKSKSWAGAGGISLSGAGILERVKEWIASGGLSVGDSAATLKIKTWSPGSGIQTGGEADKVYEVGGGGFEEFEHFPDGGSSSIGGQFTFVKEKICQPDGLLIQVGGSAVLLTVKAITGSGGAQTSGAAVLSKIKEWISNGGVNVSGIAEHEFDSAGFNEYDHEGSGGATVGGAFQFRKSKVFLPDGGSPSTGGIGSHLVVIVHLADGGISTSGGAIFEKVKEIDGSGGPLVSGHASAIKVKIFDPDGNLIYVSGTADKEYLSATAIHSVWKDIADITVMPSNSGSISTQSRNVGRIVVSVRDSGSLAVDSQNTADLVVAPKHSRTL